MLYCEKGMYICTFCLYLFLNNIPMKISLPQFKKVGASIAAGVAALAAPLSAFAAFSDGMVIPSGTTTNFTDSLTTYFFPTILATVFQSQVIQILVVVAAVAVMWFVIRLIISKFRTPHH